MANLTPKSLYIGNDSAANVYTVSSTAGNYSIIRNINICNTGASIASCNVHIVPSSGTPLANNKILSNFQVQIGETISYDASIVMPASSKIYVTSSPTTVTYVISGVEYS